MLIRIRIHLQGINRFVITVNVKIMGYLKQLLIYKLNHAIGIIFRFII